MQNRLIEYDLPLAEISEQSAREKNIRHGHPSTLHIWWARRPLASSRATAFAALIDDPGEDHPQEREEIHQLIQEITPWEAVKDGNSPAIERAREMILKQYGRSPRVLDPFAGGGSIPLEALRLGCETYAGDINPLAHLIELGTLVYPQAYGQVTEQAKSDRYAGPLVKDICKWSEWVLARTKEKIGCLYQDPVNDEPVVGYLWARTVRCPNPACQAKVPLVPDWWISRSREQRIALKPVGDQEANRLSFEIVQGDAIKNLEPAVGTFRRGRAICPLCEQSFDPWRRVDLGTEQEIGDTPLAVITRRMRKLEYRPFTEHDERLFAQAEPLLASVDTSFLDQPLGKKSEPQRFRRFGLNLWRDMFNDRQLLALVTLAQGIQAAYREMLAQEIPLDRAKVVSSYLALGLSQAANANSSLTAWTPTNERGSPVSAMPVRYYETNVLESRAGGWPDAVKRVCSAVEQASFASTTPATVQRGTATRLSYPDEHFDAVITDPPYYNAVPYADLSRFSQVWIEQAVGALYPDAFAPVGDSSQASEPSEEVNMEGVDREAESAGFRKLLCEALGEIQRVLVSTGILVMLFPCHSIVFLDLLIDSLAHAKLETTACWPLQTEHRPVSRLRGNSIPQGETALIITCRKRAGEPQGCEFAHFQARVRSIGRETLARHKDEGTLADLAPNLLSQLLVTMSQSYPVVRATGEPTGETVSLSEIWDIVQDEINDVLIAQEIEG